MGQNEYVKVTTTIPKETWLMAVTNNLPWNKCLIIGIEAQIGLNTHKQELIEQKEGYRAKILAIEQKIKMIDKEESNKRKKLLDGAVELVPQPDPIKEVIQQIRERRKANETAKNQ